MKNLSGYSISLVSEVNGIYPLLEPLNELRNECIERNVFFEPAVIIPAFRHLADENVFLLMVWREDRLTGFFPLEISRSWKRLPLKNFRLWRNRYSYLSTPIIHRCYFRETMECFLNWIHNKGSFPHLLEAEMLSATPEVIKVITAASSCTGSKIRFSSGYDRPYFKVKGSFDEYLNSRSRKRRKQIRAKKRRLEELGNLEFEVLRDAADVSTWTTEYIELEASGWKGKNGTAIATSNKDVEYFHDMTTFAFNADQLLMFRLRLNNRTLASFIVLTSGPVSYAYRIAFDEDYGQYSPGWILQVEFIRYLLEMQKVIKVVDSCAASDVTLFTGIWDETFPVTALTSVKSATFESAWRYHSKMKAAGKSIASSLVAACDFCRSQ